jgi:hypothetical protein
LPERVAAGAGAGATSRAARHRRSKARVIGAAQRGGGGSPAVFDGWAGVDRKSSPPHAFTRHGSRKQH